MTKNKIPVLPLLYFISDLEELLRRDRQTIRRWWKRKIFPEPALINNRQAWHAETINNWINKHTQGA